jgi:calcyclin binding protein
MSKSISMAGNRKVTLSGNPISSHNVYRVYITSGVDGIGKHPKSNIDCEFTDSSIDLRVLDYNKKNLRLKINPLNGLIDPASCKMKVKSNSIVLELKKATKKFWDDVKEKKKPTAGLVEKKKEKRSAVDDLEDESKDPGASLMQMMKELYETGDEQMKRTIAESWTKA